MRPRLHGLVLLFSIFGGLASPAAANGYRVQLAAYHTEAGARGGWAKLKGAYSDLLSSFEPILEWVELGPGKGTLLRLQVGPFGTAAEADSLCKELRRRGASCNVVLPGDAGHSPISNGPSSQPQPQSGNLAARVEELEDEVLELKVDSLQAKVAQLEERAKDRGNETTIAPPPPPPVVSEPEPALPPPPNEDPVPEQPDEEAPVPSHGYVHAIIGTTFDPQTDVIAGGAVGFRVTRNLNITGEVGYLRDVTLTPISYFGPLIPIYRRDPAIYAMGGVRYLAPLSGWAQPYVDAGLGVAHLEPVFHGTFEGRDITRDLRVINELPAARNTSELMWSLGGGVSVRHDPGIALDFGYRYLAIGGTTVAHVHRIQVGIGYAF